MANIEARIGEVMRRYPSAMYPSDFSFTATGGISQWLINGTQPTEAEFVLAETAAATAQATAKSEAAALKQQIFALAQSAVGVRVDLLTAAQVRALQAIQLWQAGAVDTLLKIRPLAEWVRSGDKLG